MWSGGSTSSVCHRVGLDGHRAGLIALEIALRVEDVGRRGALGRDRQRHGAASRAGERERTGDSGHRLAKGDRDARVGGHLVRAVRGVVAATNGDWSVEQKWRASPRCAGWAYLP